MSFKNGCHIIADKRSKRDHRAENKTYIYKLEDKNTVHESRPLNSFSRVTLKLKTIKY